ncbi:MAG: hypothetical protein H0U60_02500 [Blastocatellia bacterium]|nr:hypothetical protein [Blastocatellia bacterium]
MAKNTDAAADGVDITHPKKVVFSLRDADAKEILEQHSYEIISPIIKACGEYIKATMENALGYLNEKGDFVIELEGSDLIVFDLKSILRWEIRDYAQSDDEDEKDYKHKELKNIAKLFRRLADEIDLAIH